MYLLHQRTLLLTLAKQAKSNLYSQNLVSFSDFYQNNMNRNVLDEGNIKGKAVDYVTFYFIECLG
ncbi:hypothetical protein ELY21_08440 [Legionella sp. km535]|uniref:hypothetical protein n=1 Tax=Legionella sp. km535 TaxID=2498107 RepID=UPI000F8C548B|nr:hypothetical protein [Legionella sp. km535]RUR18247.1 hypothetical protein ELY21_08440 [Legionella sp. km535]